MTDNAIAAQIAALERAFLAQLPERIAQLERALLRMPQETEAAKAAHLIVHRLAGAGATFGCPEVSVAARAMEESMFPRVSERSNLDSQALVRLPALMAALKLAAERAVSERLRAAEGP